MADAPPAGPSGPSSYVASARDWYARRKLDPATLTLIVLWLAVSGLASFLISPGLYGQQIPQLRAEDVGKVWPHRPGLPRAFKANREYQIADVATTERRRLEARAAARTVYDFDPHVEGELRVALEQGFGEMRRVLAQAEGQGALGTKAGGAAEGDAAAPGVTPEGGATVASGTEPGAEAARPRRKEQQSEPDARAMAALESARPALEQRLGAFEDEDFRAFALARFSVETERAVRLLIDRAYVTPVVAAREDLPTDAPGGGITIRDVSAGAERQSPVTPPALADLREVRAELDRVASLPGTLLPDAPHSLRRAALRFAKKQIRPNLTIARAETESRRTRAAGEVQEVPFRIKKGQKLIGDGELIDERHLLVFEGMRAQSNELDDLQLQLGSAGLVAMLIASLFGFHRSAFRRFRPTRKDALLLAVLVLGTLGLIQLSGLIGDAIHDRYAHLPLEAFNAAIPVAAAAAIVRFVLAEELALFFALLIACLAGVMMGNSLAFGIYTLVGSLAAADRIARAKDRVGILRAGLFTGMANCATVFLFSLAAGRGLLTETFVTALFALVGTTLLVPMMVMALTPLVEATFGYASDIKLLELANLNHPALKELIVQAPGTYHHSIIIGTLVENAAAAIGANPLLARSCAYYHDIGKGKNPLYFGENQRGENKHDTLAPAMSAVIIKRHVTEGLEMARQYRLPKLVADAIPQHHGTRLVGFFFHKALKEQEGKENPTPIDESVYRYPGPKPQFREAALVMIADAVEASTRSLPDVTTPKLHATVQKMINLIFSEGQLDECDLTLKDLNLIAASFVHTLEGIYHGRPAYPSGALGATLRPGEVRAPAPLQLAGGNPSSPPRAADGGTKR